MHCVVVRLPAFDRQCKVVYKTYPQAEREIDDEIEALGRRPDAGDVYPGFHPFWVRKVRIGLRAYRLSSARGLRLIFLHFPDKGKVYPLVLYKKGMHGSEKDVRDLIRRQLAAILDELP